MDKGYIYYRETDDGFQVKGMSFHPLKNDHLEIEVAAKMVAPFLVDGESPDEYDLKIVNDVGSMVQKPPPPVLAETVRMQLIHPQSITTVGSTVIDVGKKKIYPSIIAPKTGHDVVLSIYITGFMEPNIPISCQRIRVGDIERGVDFEVPEGSPDSDYSIWVYSPDPSFDIAWVDRPLNSDHFERYM